MQDYNTITELVHAINHLNSDSEAYSAAIKYKVSGVDNPYLLKSMKEREWTADEQTYGSSYFDTFPCYLCKQLHKPTHSLRQSKSLGCPSPQVFDIKSGSVNPHSDMYSMWHQIYHTEMNKGDGLFKFISVDNITSNLSKMKLEQFNFKFEDV